MFASTLWLQSQGLFSPRESGHQDWMNISAYKTRCQIERAYFIFSIFYFDLFPIPCLIMKVKLTFQTKIIDKNMGRHKVSRIRIVLIACCIMLSLDKPLVGCRRHCKGWVGPSPFYIFTPRSVFYIYSCFYYIFPSTPRRVHRIFGGCPYLAQRYF